MIDERGRSIDYVRIAITDRCNLRCVYCMPEGSVPSAAQEGLLTFDEIERVVRCLTALGVRTVRITGGEPMARRGCLDLVGRLHAVPGVARLTMTTNGLLLRGHMAQAKEQGLQAVNISLDTVDADLYRRITRGGEVQTVLDAIDEALDCGLQVKVNAVPLRGMTDEPLAEVARLAQERPIDVRFIELMPVGCGAALSGVPSGEVQARLEAALGPLVPENARHGDGPAQYLRAEGFIGSIGLISAMSHAFCDRCNRVRVTPDGQLKLCLNRRPDLDLRAMLRGGGSDAALTQAMAEAIRRKPAAHGFAEALADREQRQMNEIGG